MAGNMALGPLLGYEGEQEGKNDGYTVCFLSFGDIQEPELLTGDGGKGKFSIVGETANGKFWRAELPLKMNSNGRSITYRIESEGKPLEDRQQNTEWSFYIPGEQDNPRILFLSCNGFSSAKLARNATDPYTMWRKVLAEHQDKPFSLMIMGGDQIYADQIWESKITPTVKAWTELDEDSQEIWKVNRSLAGELDLFYEILYLQGWSNPEMAGLMATIPNVMMWDDHDIFDGWGSHPKKLQDSDMYKAIYGAASKYFSLLQIRSDKNAALLNNKAGAHYSLGLKFRNNLILALDARSRRQLKQIMDEKQWEDIKQWMERQSKIENVMCVTGVPVVYRSFADVERFMEVTPWREELEDDVFDHWTSKHHQGERNRLIRNLFEFTEHVKAKRSLILSGDVHVGGLGMFRNRSNNTEIFQIISSGVVHPPPTWLQWVGMCAVTDDQDESIGKGDIVARMLTPYDSDKYIRSRNFSILEQTDKEMWIKWVCEKDYLPKFMI